MVCVHDRLPVGRIGLVCPVASIRSRLEDRDLLKANRGSFYLRAGRARRSGLSDGLARFGVSSSPIRRSLSRTGHRGRFLGRLTRSACGVRSSGLLPLSHCFQVARTLSNLESLGGRIPRECVERHRHEVAADAKDTPLRTTSRSIVLSSGFINTLETSPSFLPSMPRTEAPSIK